MPPGRPFGHMTMIWWWASCSRRRNHGRGQPQAKQYRPTVAVQAVVMNEAQPRGGGAVRTPTRVRGSNAEEKGSPHTDPSRSGVSLLLMQVLSYALSPHIWIWDSRACSFAAGKGSPPPTTTTPVLLSRFPPRARREPRSFVPLPRPCAGSPPLSHTPRHRLVPAAAPSSPWCGRARTSC